MTQKSGFESNETGSYFHRFFVLTTSSCAISITPSDGGSALHGDSLLEPVRMHSFPEHARAFTRSAHEFDNVDHFTYSSFAKGQAMVSDKKLIVNADDYGRTPGVSAGIRKSYLEGIVTTTTVLMNVPSVTNDLVIAKTECPNLGYGVHLNLAGGVPLRPPETVSSLVTPKGKFYNIKQLIHMFSDLDSIQLRDEWKAQIEAFLNTGMKLDHLDSHYHLSYLHEKPFEIMLTLAQEYHVAIRHVPDPSTPDLTGNICINDFPRLLNKYSSVRHLDRLYTSFTRQYATMDKLLDLLKDLPLGSSEIMVHPGLADDELRSISSYNIERERELAILTLRRVREYIEAYNIELITFAKL